MIAERISNAYLQACRLDVLTTKPGNLFIGSDGHGMRCGDFLLSASVSGPVIADPDLRLGDRILQAVVQTRRAVGCNTNLGIILLCAPIAQAQFDEPDTSDLAAAVERVIADCDPLQSQRIFDAIALAAPGGLGHSDRYDVNQQHGAVTLLEAMRHAAQRDSIAGLYATGFQSLFEDALARLRQGLCRQGRRLLPVSELYLHLLASRVDSHVQRKHGAQKARWLLDESRDIQQQYAAAGDGLSAHRLLLDFDRRLKAARINPGSTADWVVASLFLALLQGANSGDFRETMRGRRPQPSTQPRLTSCLQI